jgi:antitoxin component of MazEF toxin-antitoxin module
VALGPWGYSRRMVTRLSIVGGGVVLPLEDALLTAVGVTRDAEFEVTVEGDRIVLTPSRTPRAERVAGAVLRVLAEHDDTFRKLAQ